MRFSFVTRCGLIVTALTLVLPAMLLRAQGSGGKALPDLKTKPERTEYRETSRYDDVVAFMDAAAKASPAIHLTTFGKTFEGRSLPLAVVGAPDATPEAVKRTTSSASTSRGTSTQARSKARSLRRSCIRELAEGKHADLLQSMVLLIAPIYNADGNERFALTNRGRQNGPVGGQGQRPNAQNYDLNRDHMKLDSPEARAFVKLMTDYDPQVAMDLHTTNGSRHGYYLTYAPPLNPATDPVDHRPAAERLAAIGHQDDQVQIQLGLLLLRQPRGRETPSARGARSTTGRASTTTTSDCAIAWRS